MAFNKKGIEDLKEAPLGYWEEKSYMLVVPEENTKELSDKMLDRVSNMEGVEIKEIYELTKDEPGKIKIVYEGEEYEVRILSVKIFNARNVYK